MFVDKTLSNQILKEFNFEETKKNLRSYFEELEKLEWEWAKLKAQNGLTANYDFSTEYKRQPYIPIGKDTFNLSMKDNKEEQLKKYISSYHWAMSVLSNMERAYIQELFINGKSQDELVDLLGFSNFECREFRRFRKSAIYKIADFLNLIVKAKGE